MLQLANLRILLPLWSILATSAIQESPSDKDMKAMQGKWEIVSIKENGKNLKLDEPRFFVLKEDVIRVIELGMEKKFGTFSVDASKMPKVIDIDANKRKILCIYELNGDELKLCGKEGNRPTNFSSTEKDMQALILFKRAKN